MPFFLELGSDAGYGQHGSVGRHHFSGKAIVVNSKTGKHYSSHPIPIEKAKAQKRVLEAAAQKETK